MKNPRKAFTCPVCGEEVSPNAKACAECGACDKSGWSADSQIDGLDLPDDEEAFDHDAFVAEEFGHGKKTIPTVWWIVAVIVLFAFAAMSLHVFLLAK